MSRGNVLSRRGCGSWAVTPVGAGRGGRVGGEGAEAGFRHRHRDAGRALVRSDGVADRVERIAARSKLGEYTGETLQELGYNPAAIASWARRGLR